MRQAGQVMHCREARRGVDARQAQVFLWLRRLADVAFTRGAAPDRSPHHLIGLFTSVRADPSAPSVVGFAIEPARWLKIHHHEGHIHSSTALHARSLVGSVGLVVFRSLGIIPRAGDPSLRLVVSV